MNNREKLIQIIRQSLAGTLEVRLINEIAPRVADHLDSNGVVVIPCKVGDMIYRLDTLVDMETCKNCTYYYEGGMGDYSACEKTMYGNRAGDCIEIKQEIATIGKIAYWIYEDCFNKTVFLTKEEAEQKLAEQKLKELKENYKRSWQAQDGYDGIEELCDCKDMEAIGNVHDNSETANMKEVKHGKWDYIDEDIGYRQLKCSLCEKQLFSEMKNTYGR